MATDTLVGRFEMLSSENYSAYLQELGVGTTKRKLAETDKPTILISQNGTLYTIDTKSTLGNSKIEFEIGKEFEQTLVDGVASKTIIQSANDGRLVELADVNGTTSTAEWKTHENELVITYHVGDVTAVRKFQRL